MQWQNQSTILGVSGLTSIWIRFRLGKIFAVTIAFIRGRRKVLQRRWRNQINHFINSFELFQYNLVVTIFGYIAIHPARGYWTVGGRVVFSPKVSCTTSTVLYVDMQDIRGDSDRLSQAMITLRELYVWEETGSQNSKEGIAAGYCSGTACDGVSESCSLVNT